MSLMPEIQPIRQQMKDTQELIDTARRSVEERLEADKKQAALHNTKGNAMMVVGTALVGAAGALGYMASRMKSSGAQVIGGMAAGMAGMAGIVAALSGMHGKKEAAMREKLVAASEMMLDEAVDPAFLSQLTGTAKDEEVVAKWGQKLSAEHKDVAPGRGKS